MDSLTNVPIAYAHIAVKNDFIGVISNAEGAFEFHIPVKNLNDSLFISRLGYESFVLPIVTLDGNQFQTFLLKEKVIVLKEITITATKKTAEEILTEAFNRQRENAPPSPYALDLFVRELFYFNDSCCAIVESAAELLGEKYPKPGLDIYLNQIRGAIGLKPDFPTCTDNYNPFRDFRGIIGSRGKVVRPCKDCTYEIDGYAFAEGQPVAIVSLKYQLENSNTSYCKYVIGLNDYAILKFEFETYMAFGKAFVQSFNAIKGSLISLTRIIEYKPLNGHYYLKSYRQEIKHEYRNANASPVYITSHSFLVLANLVQTQNIESLKSKKNPRHVMDYESTLFSQKRDNEPEFWENYNRVERTNLEDKLYDALSRNKR